MGTGIERIIAVATPFFLLDREAWKRDRVTLPTPEQEAWQGAGG